MFRITENESLLHRHTFGVEVKASRFLETDEPHALLSNLAGFTARKEEILFLGEGSNVLFVKDYPGLIIHPVNEEMQVLEETGGEILIEAGAGRNWDQLVEWSVNHGWYGMENLSAIPGSVGAVPVQNIGAYGAEAASLITEVRVLDLEKKKAFWLPNPACRFAYRNSIFKQAANQNWLVWSVRFRLQKHARANLSYRALAEKFGDQMDPKPEEVRRTVIAIRSSKLPDPSQLGNAGSFFKNPVVDRSVLENLQLTWPGVPWYETENAGRVKLAAGWLIEQCGLKGFQSLGARVYDKQALVLVNDGQASGQGIQQLAAYVSSQVADRFGISLEPEVRMI